LKKQLKDRPALALPGPFLNLHASGGDGGNVNLRTRPCLTSSTKRELIAFAHDQSPFTDADYLRFVDGKPRRDGVHDFFASRGIVREEGAPDDSPDADTVAAIGNRKTSCCSSYWTSRASRSIPAR